MDDIWNKRFDMLRFLGWLALASPVIALGAAITSGTVKIVCTVFGVGLFLPGFVYTYVVVIWHWKARYRGSHSDLWGALILLEASGWTKLIYFFRHLLPDIHHSGRYQR